MIHLSIFGLLTIIFGCTFLGGWWSNFEERRGCHIALGNIITLICLAATLATWAAFWVVKHL